MMIHGVSFGGTSSRVCRVSVFLGNGADQVNGGDLFDVIGGDGGCVGTLNKKDEDLRNIFGRSVRQTNDTLSDKPSCD